MGAISLDRDLLNNNFEEVEKTLQNNKESNPYKLTKLYRLLDIARDEYETDFKIDNLSLKLNNDQIISLGSLKDETFFDLKEDSKTLLVSIYGPGLEAYDYTYRAHEYEKIKPLFDSTVSFGDGTHPIDAEFCNKGKFEQFTSSAKLDLAVVKIDMHDEQEHGALEHLIGGFKKIA